VVGCSDLVLMDFGGGTVICVAGAVEDGLNGLILLLWYEFSTCLKGQHLSVSKATCLSPL